MIEFFFYKQKTAYEMRISDWSSDVCSSDLGVLPLPGEVDQVLPRLVDSGPIPGGAGRDVFLANVDGLAASADLALRPVEDDVDLVVAVQQPIGRESCRESVWQ